MHRVLYPLDSLIMVDVGCFYYPASSISPFLQYSEFPGGIFLSLATVINSGRGIGFQAFH